MVLKISLIAEIEPERRGALRPNALELREFARDGADDDWSVACKRTLREMFEIRQVTGLYAYLAKEKGIQITPSNRGRVVAAFYRQAELLVMVTRALTAGAASQ